MGNAISWRTQKYSILQHSRISDTRPRYGQHPRKSDKFHAQAQEVYHILHHKFLHCTFCTKNQVHDNIKDKREILNDQIPTNLVHIFRNISPKAQSWYRRKTGLSSTGTRIGTITKSSNRSPIKTGITNIWTAQQSKVKLWQFLYYMLKDQHKNQGGPKA